MSKDDDKKRKTLLHYALDRLDRRISRVSDRLGLVPEGLSRARFRLARLIENFEDKKDR